MIRSPFDENRLVDQTEERIKAGRLKLVRLDPALPVLRDFRIREMPKTAHIVNMEHWLDLNA